MENLATELTVIVAVVAAVARTVAKDVWRAVQTRNGGTHETQQLGVLRDIRDAINTHERRTERRAAKINTALEVLKDRSPR